MAHIVVVSGSGRYADPWHPFAMTSECVAGVLRDAGHAVTIDSDVDGRLADLRDVDLLVLNIGAGTTPQDRADVESSDDRPAAPPSATDAATRRGILDYLGRGGPLLPLHVSSTSLGYMPEWESILGGIWLRGTSMHPPYSPAHVEVATDAHPVTAGIRDFDVLDERYSFLRVSPAVTQLAWHEHEGGRHPLLWTHEWHGSRVVYDALGHDAASFESAEHQAIVRQAAGWQLG